MPINYKKTKPRPRPKPKPKPKSKKGEIPNPDKAEMLEDGDEGNMDKLRSYVKTKLKL